MAAPNERNPDRQIDPRVRSLIERVLVASPLGRTLGFELVEAAPDRVALRLPFRPSNVTVGDTVHGGVIAALIDAAGAAGSVSAADPDKLAGGATSALTVSYLAPADGVELVATALVVQRTGRQTVSDVSVHDPQGRLVAKALVTSRLFAKGSGVAGG